MQVALIETNSTEEKCDKCEERFAMGEELRVHVETVHHQPVRVQCDQCNLTFSTRVILDVHVKSVHLESRKMLQTTLNFIKVVARENGNDIEKYLKHCEFTQYFDGPCNEVFSVLNSYRLCKIPGQLCVFKEYFTKHCFDLVRVSKVCDIIQMECKSIRTIG